ncbi:MAG: MFS transporter [Gemmatimonadetes bacterium]|nr:MFS transporter [Gemmatimonadota bacterium]
MTEEKLPATVKGLSLVSFFNDIASEMIYPLLPAFLTGTLGASAVSLGALDGAADLTSAGLKWVTGRLSDRPGWRKPLILVGYGTAVLVRPLIAVANAAWQVIGFRVIDRVGKGLRTAPRDAMLAESTPPALHGRAFGFHSAADHLGAMLGSLTAWFVVSRGVEVRRVIGWSAAPGIIAVIVLAIVLKGQGKIAAGMGRETRDERRGMGDEPPRGANVSPLSSLVSRSFNTPIILLALLTLFRLPETLLLFRLQQLGVPVAVIPLAWAGLHVVRSSASYPAGRLNDRFGPDLLIGGSAALFAFCLCLLGKPLPEAGALAVFLLFGFFAALTEPAERALVAKLSPASLGKGFGVYHALTGFAALPAGVAFGWIYARSGPSDAIWLSAAGVGVMGVVWVVFRRSAAAPSTPAR